MGKDLQKRLTGEHVLRHIDWCRKHSRFFSGSVCLTCAGSPESVQGSSDTKFFMILSLVTSWSRPSENGEYCIVTATSASILKVGAWRVLQYIKYSMSLTFHYGFLYHSSEDDTTFKSAMEEDMKKLMARQYYRRYEYYVIESTSM